MEQFQTFMSMHGRSITRSELWRPSLPRRTRSRGRRSCRRWRRSSYCLATPFSTVSSFLPSLFARSEWLAAKSPAADDIARQAELEALEEEQIVDTSDLFLTHNQYTTPSAASGWRPSPLQRMRSRGRRNWRHWRRSRWWDLSRCRQSSGAAASPASTPAPCGLVCSVLVLVSVDGGFVTSPPLDWHPPALLPQKQPAWLQIGRSNAAFLAVRVCVLAGYV